jgi:polyisoprenoid-binding protein YceI
MRKGNSECTGSCWWRRKQAGTLATMSQSPPQIALLAALAFAGSAHAQSQTYQFDPVHSQVVFSIEHNGFSRSIGRAPVIHGELHLDEKNLAAASASLDIDMRRVDMGNPDWNKAVQASSLLDTATYPTAHFQSTSVETSDNRQGTIHGQLTLHGVTRPLDISFHVNRVAKTIYGMHTVAGISANAMLNRNDFGITANAGSIGSTVNFWLEVEAIRGEPGTATQDLSHAAAQ